MDKSGLVAVEQEKYIYAKNSIPFQPLFLTIVLLLTTVQELK